MLSNESRCGAMPILKILLIALAISLLATCTFGFIPGNPIFCNSFCSKCQGCYATEDSWSDDNCEWMVDSGAFEMGDCLEGCGAGEVPGHPMPPTWETWSCEQFDDFL